MTRNIGQWASIGPTLILEDLGATGRVTTIAIDPSQPSTLYAGALTGTGVGGCGIWKTLDRGNTWHPIADALPSLKVSALAIAPGQPQTVYAAILSRSSDSGSLYRSNDAGGTWTLVGQSPALRGRALIIDPTTPSRMFMATAQGVHRSIDGGAGWVTVLAPAGASVSDLAIDPTVPSRLLAGVCRPTSDAVAGVYETNDSGTTWRKLTGCPGGLLPTNTAGRTIRIALGIDRTYVGFQTAASWSLYRTGDIGCLAGGQHEQLWQAGWVAGSAIAPTLWSFLYVLPGDNDVVYATGTDLRRSTDGGTTFALVGGPHVDHHAFAADPGDANAIYVGTDGGIYRSTNRGATGSWSFVGRGMANTEFYAIAHAPTNPALVFGGTQDNGTIRSRPGDTIWDWIRGGDGATVAIDPTDEGIVYAMYQYASSIAKQVYGGGWQPLNAGLPLGSTCFNLHFQVHPTDPSILLASCGSLWRTTTQPPGDWRAIFPPAGFPSTAGGVVRSAVDPSRDIYYAATNGGELYAGVGGAGWERVFDVLALTGNRNTIRDVTVDPDDPAVVYVALGGETAGRVVLLRRTDPHLLAMAATGISGDLPAGVHVTALAVDRMNAQTVYAGTDDRAVFRGRYIAASGTWRWDLYSNGLPAATAVQELLVHPTTGVLRAGTSGRGAYEVDTDYPIGSVLALEGVPTYLRIHDSGGYGPPTDRIDGEVVFKLDADEQRAFGFSLRIGAGRQANVGMLRLLRRAFAARTRVRVEYVRTGIHNGRAFRLSTRA